VTFPNPALLPYLTVKGVTFPNPALLPHVTVKGITIPNPAKHQVKVCSILTIQIIEFSICFLNFIPRSAY
jgi:hypothetical protein